MKYEWMRKASDWFIASVVLLLIVIAYGGCGPKILVGDISVQPAPKVEVSGKLSVSISIDNPPDGKRLRFAWNAKGKVPNEDQPGGEYIAPSEPGTDTITCKVWSDSKHLATRTATVEVLPAAIPKQTAESGQPKSQEPKKTTQTSPSITITLVPPSGAGESSWGTIAGNVQGVNVNECKVVIFAYGNTWYVQPWVASPYTEIDKDGNWETGTHLGFEYAALLVKDSYKPPATTSSLPKVGGDVLAIAKATPKE